MLYFNDSEKESQVENIVDKAEERKVKIEIKSTRVTLK